MHYLIDGHNLIARLPDISLDDPNDEVKCVLRLRQWAAGNARRRITVVFDHGLPGGRAKGLSSGPVRVDFAPTGQTADALLIRRLRRLKDPGAHRLITSDRQILAVARERGIPFWRSESFVRRLEKERRERAAGEGGQDEPRLTEAEVAEWLALFGPEPERSPAEAATGRRRRTTEDPAGPEAGGQEAGKKGHELRTSKADDVTLDQDEISEWLRLFGDQGDSS